MASFDWVRGDMLGLDIPAHHAALEAGGEEFLTAAFRAAGALAPDNRVRRITQCQECFGGGTGRKLLLSVAYEKPQAGLHADLFVKFSRDFDDPRRDNAKHMMGSEVRFAILSAAPGFPITVPKCYFADFHEQSGTGILITERVAYGSGSVERHYEKCLDYEMPDPLAHYRALVTALARLAGAHKAGRLPETVAREYPFDAEEFVERDRIAYTGEQLQRRVARMSAFVERFRHLFPASLTADFFARFSEDVPRLLAHELAIRRFLAGNADFIALCHWNANVDNAWFWRDGEGDLACGLLDWGAVGQMNIGQALYGALSGAEVEIWDRHLDELLTLFVSEFARCGGPVLDVEALKLHLHFTVATMGLAYIMDAPALVQKNLPDIDKAESRFDPRFGVNEEARVWLHMMTMFLNQWQTQDFGKILDRFLDRGNAGARA